MLVCGVGDGYLLDQRSVAFGCHGTIALGALPGAWSDEVKRRCFELPEGMSDKYFNLF